MTRIMVVDDMAVFREPIAAALRQRGFETSCAVDGQSAMDVAHRHHPDLILLDLAMPKMDGLAFLRARRTDPVLLKSQVILLTAVADPEHIAEANRLGVRDYLLKSQFSLDQLMHRIRDCLEGSGGATDRADCSLIAHAD